MKDIKTLATDIVRELEDNKIIDVEVYDLTDRSSVADFHIVSTADNMLQLESVRNYVIDLMDKSEVALKNPLEKWEGGWALLDFGDIIVHILLSERRSFYNLDNLLDYKNSISNEFKNVSNGS